MVEIINNYGLDPLRYYLLKEVSFGNDGNISKDKLESCINSDLANNYGNLCQRVITFCEKNIGLEIPKFNTFNEDDLSILNNFDNNLKKLDQEINNQNINQNELLSFFKNKGSIVSQNGSALNVSALQNIILESKFDKQKLEKVLDTCLLPKLFLKDDSINDFYNRKISTMSGGQIQRILMARSLYKGSEILIIDEGLNQLDIENEIELFDNITKLGITIIMVYHRISKSKNFNKIYKLSDKKLTRLNAN